MAEIRTVTTLRNTCAEIKSTIGDYEAGCNGLRADLVHYTAAIAIFEANSDRGP